MEEDTCFLGNVSVYCGPFVDQCLTIAWSGKRLWKLKEAFKNTFRQTKNAASQGWGVATFYASIAEMQASDMRDSGDLHAIS